MPWWPESLILDFANPIVSATITLVGIYFVAKGRHARSYNLAQQILWATTATYVIACVGYLWVEWHQFLDALLVVWVLIVFLVFCWCIPLLILWRRKNNWLHNWHVWGAWACTTLPLLWELLVHKREVPLIAFGGNILAPPVAALIGVIFGEILFRLRRLSSSPLRGKR